jgi:saccharopine dehydrogenase-like NADP-dependent oxidoreductase
MVQTGFGFECKLFRIGQIPCLNCPRLHRLLICNLRPAETERMSSTPTILVLGAGRSSSSLIDELLKRAPAGGWRVAVGDLDGELAARKVAGHAAGESFALDPSDNSERDRRIASARLVISMVPAFLHPEIAAVAIEAGVDVLTPSYLSAEMLSLDAAARAKGVLVLNELGLDPGIDHLSACAMMDAVRAEGGRITEFESYCGGLVAPESDTNPWHYKVSWNPRNVVLAGQGGAATFRDGGRDRLVPPHRVFQNFREVEVDGMTFEGYPNRDSLAYEKLYHLPGVDTLIRGTLRGDGFCGGWDVLVALGCVRDDAAMTWPEGTTWAEWLRTFLPAEVKGLPLPEAVVSVTGASGGSLERLEWLGLFSTDEGPSRLHGSPAAVLQDLIEAKWQLMPEDRDMIVMWHRLRFEIHGEVEEIIATLRRDGRENPFTAMSDTVGFPLALAAEVMLGEGFGRTGVEAPFDSVYYSKLLPGLEALGVRFHEVRSKIPG